MAKKNHNQASNSTGVSFVETAVVGAGISGLLAARSLQRAYPAMQILVLEAEDRIGGRILGGLHLVDQEACRRFSLHCTQELFHKPCVRWERAWVDEDQVDWMSKEWVTPGLPQWKTLFSGQKNLALGLADSDVEVAVKTRAAVRNLYTVKAGELPPEFGDLPPAWTADSSFWVLETSDRNYVVKTVIWAAGLKAFQHAYGKKAAQKFLSANPLYQKDAADFRGGLAFELQFTEKPRFTESFDDSRIMALPVRHNGKLFLLYGALVQSQGGEGWILKTLVHLPPEILSDPKEIVSIQKSLRRGIKHVLEEGSQFPDELHMRWVVEDRVAGHVLGTSWVLGEGLPGSLEFVGEETLAAAESGRMDAAAALHSVNSLTLLKVSAHPVEQSFQEVQVF